MHVCKYVFQQICIHAYIGLQKFEIAWAEKGSLSCGCDICICIHETYVFQTTELCNSVCAPGCQHGITYLRVCEFFARTWLSFALIETLALASRVWQQMQRMWSRLWQRHVLLVWLPVLPGWQDLPHDCLVWWEPRRDEVPTWGWRQGAADGNKQGECVYWVMNSYM